MTLETLLWFDWLELQYRAMQFVIADKPVPSSIVSEIAYLGWLACEEIDA